MNKLLAGAATTAVVAVSPAVAADMRPAPFPEPYVVAPVPGWTGAYVGLNLGYQLGKVDNLPLKPNGVLGGIQGGYNWQTGQFVLGAETDLQLSSADATFAPYQFSNAWFGTVRGRAGMTFSNVLVYATGGLAYGRGRLTFAGLTEKHTDAGWTAAGNRSGTGPDPGTRRRTRDGQGLPRRRSIGPSWIGAPFGQCSGAGRR